MVCVCDPVEAVTVTIKVAYDSFIGNIPDIVRVEESKLAHDGILVSPERVAVYVMDKQGVNVNSSKLTENN